MKGAHVYRVPYPDMRLKQQNTTEINGHERNEMKHSSRLMKPPRASLYKWMQFEVPHGSSGKRQGAAVAAKPGISNQKVSSTERSSYFGVNVE